MTAITPQNAISIKILRTLESHAGSEYFLRERIIYPISETSPIAEANAPTLKPDGTKVNTILFSPCSRGTAIKQSLRTFISTGLLLTFAENPFA